MTREPALIRTAIITIVAQALTLGVTLGLLTLDPVQIASINTAVALVSAAIAALWVRSGVTPVADPDPNVVAVEKVHVVETPALTSAIAQATGPQPVIEDEPVPEREPEIETEEEVETPTTLNDLIIPDAAERDQH